MFKLLRKLSAEAKNVGKALLAKLREIEVFERF